MGRLLDPDGLMAQLLISGPAELCSMLYGAPSGNVEEGSLADLVVSAGGTMIREAAVLGTPVWSIFEGRLGAVDEQLIAEGRVRFLHDPGELAIEKAPERQRRGRRDPAELLRLALPDLG